MVKINNKGRVKVIWEVSPFDFSKSKEKDIAMQMAKKYTIPVDSIKIVPDFITYDKNGKEIKTTTDITSNIANPKFQQKLFRDYAEINHIEGCDFDFIDKIDNEINAQIDYHHYEQYKKFSIKWIKWDNFLSYGSGNIFDFRNLRGLVLLNGDNQSGKTTFAVDLIHFLLFGKAPKVATQDKIFNKHIPEATNVTVEGCLNIDGEDYVIKRTLTRPALSRRTQKSKTTQKVEYYRIVGDEKEELTEYVDNQQDDNVAMTNKKIKEAIGREDDFDLIMSITETNLDDLINKKDTERGRLFSRWIGLLPLEEKNMLAHDKFNQSVKPYFLSNQFNKETLKSEIGAYNTSIRQNEEYIKQYEKKNIELEKDIANYSKIRETLLQSKEKVDDSVMKLDITTLLNDIQSTTDKGKGKKVELDTCNDEIKAIGDVDFSVEAYDRLVLDMNNASAERATYAEQYKSVKQNIVLLQKSEYCPTCGRKLDNVDNSDKIAALQKTQEKIKNNGIEIAKKISDMSARVEAMKAARDAYNKRNELKLKKAALEMNMEQLRNHLKDCLQKQKEYNQNAAAIDKNNKLDIEIRNNDVILSEKRQSHETNIGWINQNKAKIEEFTARIAEREKIVKQLDEEAKTQKQWKIYLDMVGKNGISKMVLRETLPIINARVAQLLSDVCDFDVEVVINEKNDIAFNIIKDGVRSDLSSGSGFERTCASLALRFVLADISTLPKMQFLLMDEILGRVTPDNLPNIHRLLDKILKDYEFILHVCHIEEARDWSSMQINVSKTDNISRIEMVPERYK